jgi:hypothetical protein
MSQGYPPEPPDAQTPPQYASPPGPAPKMAPPEYRKQALAQHIASAVAAQGARVESQSDFQAVLLTGQPVNHVLHLLISIFTCGIWGIVWLILFLTGGVKRHLVQVDEYGHVLVQHI